MDDGPAFRPFIKMMDGRRRIQTVINCYAKGTVTFTGV